MVSLKSSEGQSTVQTVVRLPRPLDTKLQIEKNEVIVTA